MEHGAADVIAVLKRMFKLEILKPDAWSAVVIIQPMLDVPDITLHCIGLKSKRSAAMMLHHTEPQEPDT